MRRIDNHKVNECNEKLEIEVLDEPGEGGASHAYVIAGFDTSSNPSQSDMVCRYDDDERRNMLELLFQNGPIAEVGTNGITQEALIAICIDRLRGFQAGPYACRENALALTKLEEAQHWLHARTRAREARGVEGTHAR